MYYFLNWYSAFLSWRNRFSDHGPRNAVLFRINQPLYFAAEYDMNEALIIHLGNISLRYQPMVVGNRIVSRDFFFLYHLCISYPLPPLYRPSPPLPCNILVPPKLHPLPFLQPLDHPLHHPDHMRHAATIRMQCQWKHEIPSLVLPP